MARTRKRAATSAAEVAWEDDVLAGMNEEQVAVVTAGEGAWMVLAGAGAGKTRALVHRIAYLTAGCGVEPSSVLAVTFSKKAADEMNERLRGLGIDTDPYRGARVGTWHSLAWQILRTERPDLRGWKVDTKEQYRTILKIVLGFRGLKWHQADLTNTQRYVGICKARCAEPGTEAARAVAEEFFRRQPSAKNDVRLLQQAYVKAEEAARERQIITYDDMLLWAWRLLVDSDEVRARWAGRYSYLLQDEAQDCNPVQAEIAELLARRHGNYMIVGDPAQSIYGFRGADPSRFLAFEQEWAPVTVVRMFRNYRSGGEVISAANASARAMKPGTTLGVDMSAERGTAAEIRVADFATLEDEGEDVAQKILEAHDAGIDWRDIAVLYRTNAQSRGVEEALLGRRVPYVVLGGTNFYDRKEVKDLLAYLRLADGRGGDDEFRRCINAPFRFLGKAFVERCGDTRTEDEAWTEAVLRTADQARIQDRQRASAVQWVGLIEGLQESIRIQAEPMPTDPVCLAARKEHMPSAMISRIIADTGYIAYLTKDEGAETVENSRVSNVMELCRAAERFTTTAELLDYVDETLEAARAAKAGQDADRVTLCSLHRAKGLEWSFVTCIGTNEKILPHARAEDLEEERRLFYVGVTRARDVLHVTHVRQAAVGARVLPLEQSRFLAEAGLVKVLT